MYNESQQSISGSNKLQILGPLASSPPARRYRHFPFFTLYFVVQYVRRKALKRGSHPERFIIDALQWLGAWRYVLWNSSVCIFRATSDPLS